MALKKPIASYDGDFSIIQSGDVLDPTIGGTGLSSFTPGNFLRAESSTVLGQRTPDQVAADIGATRFTRSTTAPSSPNPGDEWLEPVSAKKYTWVNDGNSGQWVEIPNKTPTTGAASGSPVYINNTEPLATGTYFWIQTGLGDDGTDFTFWINEN